MKRSPTVVRHPHYRTERKNTRPNLPLVPRPLSRITTGPSRRRSARPPALCHGQGLAHDLDRPPGISKGKAGVPGAELLLSAVHIQLCHSRVHTMTVRQVCTCAKQVLNTVLFEDAQLIWTQLKINVSTVLGHLSSP